MTIRSGLNKKLRPAMAHDEGLVVVPFGFVINGTSDPDGIIGDLVDTVTRSEAGEFVVTLKCKVAKCFFGAAGVSETADDTQLSARVDWSTTESAGTATVRIFGAPTTTLTSGALTGSLTDGTVADNAVTDLTLSGTLTTLTGTTTGVQVDPTDNRIVGGYLLVSKTTRDGRR